MPKVMIIYDRQLCIAAGNCAYIDPQHFKINKKDGKADLIGGKRKNHLFVLETEADDRVTAAAHSCPISAICVIDKQGKRLA